MSKDDIKINILTETKRLNDVEEHNLNCVSNNTFCHKTMARVWIYQCKCGIQIIFFNPLNEFYVGETDNQAGNIHDELVKFISNYNFEVKNKDLIISKELISRIEKYIEENDEEMVCYTINGFENILKSIKKKHGI